MTDASASVPLPTRPVSDQDQFSIQERDDDMLIAERHWQWGWRCIARRPRVVSNAEWRADAERIIDALTRAAISVPLPTLTDGGVADLVDELGWPQPSPETCKRAISALTRQQIQLEELREAILEEAAAVCECMENDRSLPDEAHRAAFNLKVAIRARKALGVSSDD